MSKKMETAEKLAKKHLEKTKVPDELYKETLELATAMMSHECYANPE